MDLVLWKKVICVGGLGIKSGIGVRGVWVDWMLDVL